ncbi:MAG: patatin-like phospholipase family protein [Thiohalomonadales bacterium]
MKQNKHIKTVSLVLGSGGARGYAHIGIINWLNEHGFKIRSISGCSIGALVGGIYATGNLDVYSKWAQALEKSDVIRLLDFSFSQRGLFKGERIINVLKEMIGDYNIEDLPISYTSVATDINNQKEVWITQGPLFDAIRASIAIPMIFTPHEYLGMQLVDGSVVNPIPIAPTLNDKTDITIAVDPNGKPEQVSVPQLAPETNTTQNGTNYRKKITDFLSGLRSKSERENTNSISAYDLVSKTTEAMQSRITALQLAAYTPDVVISIPRNFCSFYEFYRAREIINAGYDKANNALSKFNS